MAGSEFFRVGHRHYIVPPAVEDESRLPEPREILVLNGVFDKLIADPLLSMPGTNDHAGDYRNSGCTAATNGCAYM